MKLQEDSVLLRIFIGELHLTDQKYIIATGVRLNQIYLIFNEPGVNQLELSRKKIVGKAGVTKALKVLEKNCLITRIVDDEEKRILRCYVTEIGNAVAHKLIEITTQTESVQTIREE